MIANGRKGATPPGLNLEELAKARGFHIDGPTGLMARGVAQVTLRGATMIRIPYMNEVGEVVAVRFRHTICGAHRFNLTAMAKELGKAGMIEKGPERQGIQLEIRHSQELLVLCSLLCANLGKEALFGKN